MKYVQWSVMVIGTVLLVVVLVGVVLPSGYEVRRSIHVAAPPDRVYDLVVDTRRWKDWSAWNRRDPAMHVSYAGPPFGMGAKWSWESKTEGRGSMEFVHVEPDRRVDYRLAFPDFNMVSRGSLVLTPTDGGTDVTWIHAGETGSNPLKHYFAAFMDRMVGRDFEQGLANLKAVAEKG
ncbi:MAG TPA: SRPBCC family protein [Usitatibacter sp.]|jgi:uncharacterized protein YndB with AHSA1/START domain|nr:SRPBCC family protein [Usitatibacter sp.]